MRRALLRLTLLFSVLPLLLSAVLASALLPAFVFAAESIAPNRQISLVQPQPEVPEWRVLWDRARELARQERYTEASRQYAELLSRKDNIEEANWEYCQVLLRIGDNATATRILAALLEKTPHRNDYLLAGARLAEEAGDDERAVRYFGKVLEKDPAGPDAEVALTGLVNSLRRQGKNSLALPLLEGLSRRRPDDRQILRTLATDAYQLGREQLARQLYNRLLAFSDIDDQVVLQAAELFDRPGHEVRRRQLWQEYLRRHPDYLPFRARLAADLIAEKQNEAALEQLQYLIDHAADNRQYLLQAGELCLYGLNRPDKALFFFARYNSRYPDDQSIMKRIRDIQSILANDFLAIVENDGAWQLWRDLAEIAPNRLAIYQEMAELLERAGKEEELLEILLILHRHAPVDDQVTLRIARHYRQAGEPTDSLAYLDEVTKAARNLEYYRLRAETERILGREQEALVSYNRVVALAPDDLSLRLTAIELAGSLGLVENVEELFLKGLDSGGDLEELYLGYLAQLSRNGLYTAHARVSAAARQLFATDTVMDTRLKLEQAKALFQEGRRRKAEQLLRLLLSQGILVDKVLFQLADHALSDQNLPAAEVWMAAIAARQSEEGNYSLRLLQLKAREIPPHPGLVDENRRDEMASLLNKELCRQQYGSGDHLLAWQTCGRVLADYGFDAQTVLIRQQLAREVPDATLHPEELLTVGEKVILSRQLALAEEELEKFRYSAAEQRLATVLNACGQSVAASLGLVELDLARGRLDDAAEGLQRLALRFPEETSFKRKMIEIEIRRGRYQQGLALMQQHVGGETVAEMVDRLIAAEETESLLTLARLLWGDREEEQALQLYQRLLDPAVVDLLRHEFIEKQLSYRSFTRESTIWNSLLSLLQSQPDLVAELMAPPFLLENIGTDAGAIVASYFERFSWQRLIHSEYQARKAIADRRYYYAEKSYRKLLEEEESADALLDLATIYSRIGKIRKEAQVYEAIQNTGTVNPELIASIERSSQQLSPQNILEAEYMRKNGREGLIDLTRSSIGTSFWIAPDLKKDIRFSYLNTHYRSTDSDASLASNRISGLATAEFGTGYELFFATGLEKLNGSSDTRFSYEAGVNGQLDDYVMAHARLTKRVVDDSVQTIRDDISFQQVSTGIDLETSFGVTFGGDLRHRGYNDGNSQNRFHGYSSYSLFAQSIELALRYDFEYLNNNREIEPEQVQQTDEYRAEMAPLYWSPASFNEHRLTADFRHDFPGYSRGSKTGTSSYSLSNAVGLEDHENISYTGLFHFFLEINQHLLLKGNFAFTTSAEYDEKGFAFSLHYRW